jgi:DNA replication and repair protein RecF
VYVVWVEKLAFRDLRNIREAALDLGPGLNVFVGRNAQGKTTLLEGVGLLARGRSFRTEQTVAVIRNGAEAMSARGSAWGEGRRTTLQVDLQERSRRLQVDGREVPVRDYQGRLEVVVYSTERLRVVRGPMRERRQFLDRSASALWPSYRQAVREYERVLHQRNAILEGGGGADLEAWNERHVVHGAALRHRRAEYVRRLNARLRTGFQPEGERYAVHLRSDGMDLVSCERELRAEVEAHHRMELRAGRSLVGPHRDVVSLHVDGREVAESASSGQARSLLLALALAALETYRAERGEAAVALLDDLDSELDDQRATALCQTVSEHGQALITTAHPAWARQVASMGRLFEVSGGEVKAA